MVKVCKALTAVNEAEVSPSQITLNPFAVQGIFKLIIIIWCASHVMHGKAKGLNIPPKNFIALKGLIPPNRNSSGNILFAKLN